MDLEHHWLEDLFVFSLPFEKIFANLVLEVLDGWSNVLSCSQRLAASGRPVNKRTSIRPASFQGFQQLLAVFKLFEPTVEQEAVVSKTVWKDVSTTKLSLGIHSVLKTANSGFRKFLCRDPAVEPTTAV